MQRFHRLEWLPSRPCPHTPSLSLILAAAPPGHRCAGHLPGGPMPELATAPASRLAEEISQAYLRYLTLERLVDPKQANRRQQFEALASAVRDVIAPRWLNTHAVRARENPKRVYYLSMEFLIGRSLTNTIANLPVEPAVREALARHKLDLANLAEMEPDAGLGNGGLGRLAACFVESQATLQLPAMGYGL